jgi:hypothetical protein
VYIDTPGYLWAGLEATIGIKYRGLGSGCGQDRAGDLVIFDIVVSVSQAAPTDGNVPTVWRIGSLNTLPLQTHMGPSLRCPVSPGGLKRSSQQSGPMPRKVSAIPVSV